MARVVEVRMLDWSLLDQLLDWQLPVNLDRK
jgi:hypothetical protein